GHRLESYRAGAVQAGCHRERTPARFASCKAEAGRQEDLMATYTLPDLTYDFGALEPHISGKIMELHHDKHHAAYVKGANETLARLDEARDQEDTTRLPGLERALAFNLSGHVLHSLFWRNLAPKAAGRPEGPLADALRRGFGSFGRVQKKKTARASSVIGCGGGAAGWGA